MLASCGDMKSDRNFNKFHTALAGLASISMLSTFLIVFKNLNSESTVLFLIVIGDFITMFTYSLGYIGGNTRGYGYSRYVNIMSLVTLFFIMLSEVEVCLYLRGLTDIITVVILQALLIIVILIPVRLAYLNHPPHNS
ncbi:hypothetical protein ACNF40_00995 [Cuniculiplasma sp. SKW4]|uniref:hypothetical protein n=1 Tax=Cuniculiplasma sp. SKW4 TaxID=3400171 RepID=UPI003FCF59E6